MGCLGFSTQHTDIYPVLFKGFNQQSVVDIVSPTAVIVLQLFMTVEMLTAQTVPQTGSCSGLYIPDGLLPSN